MTEEAVTNEFLRRQLDRVLDRLGSMEDQITVLTGMSLRHEGALNGLVVEVRGLAQSLHLSGPARPKPEDQHK